MTEAQTLVTSMSCSLKTSGLHVTRLAAAGPHGYSFNSEPNDALTRSFSLSAQLCVSFSLLSV